MVINFRPIVSLDINALDKEYKDLDGDDRSYFLTICLSANEQDEEKNISTINKWVYNILQSYP